MGKYTKQEIVEWEYKSEGNTLATELKQLASTGTIQQVIPIHYGDVAFNSHFSMTLRKAIIIVEVEGNYYK